MFWLFLISAIINVLTYYFCGSHFQYTFLKNPGRDFHFSPHQYLTTGTPTRPFLSFVPTPICVFRANNNDFEKLKYFRPANFQILYA